ncbi:MAG: NAD(+) synthase [Treponematales bacterium]
MFLEEYGFVRAAAASLAVRAAEPEFNGREVVRAMREAEAEGARLLALPELCLTGYTCGDLFHQDALLGAAEAALARVLAETRGLSVAAALGLPVSAENRLFNCAAVVQRGRVLGLVPKSFLPGYGEFYEERWFSPAPSLRAASVRLAGEEVPIGTDLLFRGEAAGGGGFVFGVELCEDLWAPEPPSAALARGGALVICNLSASNEVIGKHGYRRDLVRVQSARLCAGYVYSGAGTGESTTDLVFGGAALIAENGVLLAEGPRFSRKGEMTICDIDTQRLLNTRRRLTPFMEGGEGGGGRAFRYRGFVMPGKRVKTLRRFIDPEPFVPAAAGERDERCAEVFAIQTAGLARRLEHLRCKTVTLGVSGGLDSALALLAAVKTFDLLGLPRSGVIAVTMPGFGTTERTRENGSALIRALGAAFREVDIRAACAGHLEDIGVKAAGTEGGVTFENAQARMRTLILMDIANETGGLVIGTGDLSELALGWCTYSGDHISMYAINASIPKTLVRHLVAWAAEREADAEAARRLRAILDTPISPELLPPDAAGNIRQKTEDILGPFEAHDFFLYHFFRYGAPPEKLLFLAKEAFKGRPYTEAQLRRWLEVFLRRFFAAQFKRSCAPDGPKVGTVSLSPRGDWRMPSDAAADAWLRGCGERL